MTTYEIEQTIARAKSIDFVPHIDAEKKSGVQHADALQWVLSMGFTITCLHDYAISAHKGNQVYSWQYNPQTDNPSDRGGNVMVLTYKDEVTATEQDCRSAAHYRGEYLKSVWMD